MANRFKDDEDYVLSGRVLNSLWREIYLPLITDDGTPAHAIKGDKRRDLAQRLGGLLENADMVTLSKLDELTDEFP